MMLKLLARGYVTFRKHSAVQKREDSQNIEADDVIFYAIDGN